jgi:hypothetical protein
MVYKENLGGLNLGNKNIFIPPTKTKIGRVFAIVTTENTPTPKMYLKAGGVNGIGSIFYKEWDKSKNEIGNISDDFLDKCNVAKPLTPNTTRPLQDELIIIDTLPSAQDAISPSKQEYYSNIVGVWNNQQHNAQPAGDTYRFQTFSPDNSIKPLIFFEGDNIIQGRQGSALRFSSTTKLYNDINNWSSIGNEHDPITILTNGFDYTHGNKTHIEDINKDASSIWLTKNQSISLNPDKTGVLNNLTNPLDVIKYSSAQVIINSDRIVLNSKKDEVMLFAKTNIELNTKNVINLNADERVHLNTNTVFLGKYDETNLLQPLVLGNNVYNLLSTLLDGLYQLSADLQSVMGSPEGAPAVDINAAGLSLSNSLDSAINQLGNVLSTHNFTT